MEGPRCLHCGEITTSALLMMALTRDLTCCFACGTGYEEVSHATDACWAYDQYREFPAFLIPEVLHVIAGTQRASLSHAASTMLVTDGWISSTLSLS